MSDTALLAAAAEATALCETLAAENASLRRILNLALSILPPCASALAPVPRRAARAACAALSASAAAAAVGDKGVAAALQRVPRAVDAVLAGAGSDSDVHALMRGVDGVRRGGRYEGAVARLKANGLRRAVDAVCGADDGASGDAERSLESLEASIGRAVSFVSGKGAEGCNANAAEAGKESEARLRAAEDARKEAESARRAAADELKSVRGELEDSQVRCAVFEKRLRDGGGGRAMGAVAEAANLRDQVAELEEKLRVEQGNVKAAMVTKTDGDEVRLSESLAASEFRVKALRDALLRARVADIAVEEIEAKGVEGGLREEGVWNVKGIVEKEVRECLRRTRRSAAMARVVEIGGRRKGLTANGAEARMVLSWVSNVL